MKTLALTILLAAALTVGGGQALAAHSHDSGAKTLNVVMHDPGCHWFSIGGKLKTIATVKGPIRLRDLDEAALKVASRHGVKIVKVGKSLRLTRGHYVVMMVGQAVDDNYLKLTVR